MAKVKLIDLVPLIAVLEVFAGFYIGAFIDLLKNGRLTTLSLWVLLLSIIAAFATQWCIYTREELK